MVSQLSARLLADSSDGNRSGSGSDGECCSVGGYSADREGSSIRTGSPPGHISMHVKHRRAFASDSNERAKRRKFNEEQYAASVAKDDMKRAGCRIRPIETARSRIALGKVDMSRVKLVRSKEVESSPFLFPVSQRMAQIQYDFATESVYNSLVDSCRGAYELFDAVVTDSAESTSSFSDTESCISQESIKETVFLKPRVEDSIPTIATVTEPSSVPVEAPEDSDPFVVSMTMEEALTVCNFSRLMVLATSPYTVVHCNAACGHLTGLQSTSILGKPLFNSLGNTETPSLASCAESSAAGSNVAFSVMSDDKKIIPCNMKVTPIVSSVHNKPKITHYAVDLTPMGDESMANESPLQAVAQQPSSNNNRAIATTVVG